jgi:hypothetical protein
MKLDLQTLVDEWTHRSIMFENRSVTVQNSHGAHGELLLTLRVEMAVTYAGRTKQVSCAKLYHTYENANQSETSVGDCYRFSRQANSIDNEFDALYEAKVNELLKEQHGDGFVD